MLARLASLLVLTTGCAATSEPAPQVTDPSNDESDVAVIPDAEAIPAYDARWEPRVRQALRQYETWGRFDDQARWAPMLCRRPDPPSAHASKAPEEHRGKLYTLYFSPSRDDGAVVKQSFAPVPSDGALVDARGLAPAHHDGADHVTGTPLELYLMLYVGDEGPSDEGWIYATATPDGETITALGVVEHCARCHAHAEHERLFTPPPMW